MRNRLLPLLTFLCAASAGASSPKIWVSDSPKDFSGGTAHGVSALPTGRLALTRAAVRIDGLAATKIFSVVAEKSGAIDFGTGDEGELYRQEPGKAAALLLTLPEKEVTALTIGSDGALYAGTSPKGKVYRIEKGKAVVYFDPKAEYVWALAFGRRNALYVATGLPGKIFRVAAPGEGTVFYDSEDEHVRALLFDARGRLWAGTSGKGLLLRIEPDGHATTIYDSDKSEISALTEGPGGQLWAAAVSTRSAGASGPQRGPASPPARERKPAETTPSPGGDATVTVSTSVSMAPPSGAPPPARGAESSEIVEVDADGSVSPYWHSDDELVYSCLYDPASEGLLVATGPHGRLYLVQKGQESLSASFDEKRVVLASDSVLVTDSPASAYRRLPARQGEYFSSIKDTGRVSRFGSFRSDASIPRESSVVLSFRSGNSSVPDSTWSAWSRSAGTSAAGTIPAPAGRFLQWKAAFDAPAPDRSPVLLSVECAYQNENARPEIEAVAVGSIGREVGAAFMPLASEEPAAEGIFAGPDEKAGASTRSEGRGHLAVTWKASDPDGDELTADVDFRPADGSGAWVPMRHGLKGSSFAFDSRLLPDGRYLFRINVSDRSANPENPKSDTRISDPVIVDNTPPAIEVVSSSREKTGGVVKLRVTDALSPLAAVGWSVNAGPWTRATADDGMTDSPRESYTISFPPENRGAYVLVRAVDSAGNTSSLSIVAP